MLLKISIEFWFVFLFLLPNGECSCPRSSGISPCQCHEERTSNGRHQTTVNCRGNVGLPHLTNILHKKLCGLNLHKFSLVGSDISYLPSNLFHKVSVKHIEVTTTNVSHFTEAGYSAFYGLERTLLSLSMRHCSLVDELQWQKIAELDALDSLDLSANHLTTVPVQWFRNPPRNLKFLYLRANKISSIQSGALASMHKLMLIDLSENYLINLQRDVFPYPGNSIVIMKLSYNILSSLEKDFFDEMFSLRRLYLDNNNLNTLDAEVWIPIWSELLVLDLNGNNLTCDCSMEWLSTLYTMDRFYGKCREESTLSNRELKSLHPWDFNCTIA